MRHPETFTPSPPPVAPALRCVHLFTKAKLTALAAQTTFRITGTYFSDGEAHYLGLYQTWQPL